MRNRCRFIISVLMVLAAVSCSKEQVGDSYMLFEIHGTVLDEDGSPIEGIKVSSGLSDAQSTNVNGNFVFYGRSTPATYVVLTFEDKDGDDNGGEFVKMAVEIPLRQKTPGTSGNFKGTFFAGDVEVVMVSKNVEMNPELDPELDPDRNQD